MSAGKRVVMLSVVLLAGASLPWAAVATAAGLPAVAAADTVRTNLWLTEALMGEIVTAAARSIPPAPGAIRLHAKTTDDTRNDLFAAVAAEVLGAAGYDLYVAEEDPTRQGAVDYIFSFAVQDIDLNYPAVGRTLGIWRRWVGRELGVSVLVEVSEEETGRLLLSERMERRYGDRVENSDFDTVDEDAYDFTTAETRETGWQSRIEEIVVLGSLAGLVAIYFANTGN